MGWMGRNHTVVPVIDTTSMDVYVAIWMSQMTEVCGWRSDMKYEIWFDNKSYSTGLPSVPVFV